MNIVKFFLLSIMLIPTFVSFANENIIPITINTMDGGVYEVTTGSKLYFNACTGNPQNYSLTPLMVGETIYEVPNIVAKLDKSSYGRPFKIQAISSWKNQGHELKAQLNDFRDLKIIDSKNNKVLYTRKVSGATSLYEIKHKGVVVGWGVGWHKYCGECYSYIDFTAFRVLVPVLKNDSVTIEEKEFFGLAQTRLKEALKNVNASLLIETEHIAGSCKLNDCYYCMPKFIMCDHKKGFNEIKSMTMLKELNVEIEKINPMLFASWLAYTEQAEAFNKFIENNFFAIIKECKIFYGSTNKEAKEFFEAQKMENQWAQCIKFLHSELAQDVDLTVANCFPAFIKEPKDYSWWQDLFFVEHRRQKANTSGI